MTHLPPRRLTGKNLVDSYGPSNPARLLVAPGEVFILETHDRFIGWLDSASAPDLADPSLMGVTGAVAVAGAQPGDLLAVDVLDIAFSSDFGMVNAIPGKGAFAADVQSFTTRRVQIHHSGRPSSEEADAPGTGAYFVEFAGQRVPLRPMIGRIGTAPADRSVPSVAPGPHGGNLDVREITTGATVYLPVFVPGALLSAGDVHAAMGDGESMISGVEAMADLTLRCRLVGRGLAERLSISEPLVTTPSRFLTVASAPTLDEAAQRALHALRELIVALLDLDPIEAGMLISIAADLGVAQIVNPLVTGKVAIDRSVFDFEALLAEHGLVGQ